MDSAKKLVVITGGAGRIGTAMRPLLRSTYRLRLVDVRPPPEAPMDGEEFVEADMTDLSAAERVMAGASAAVHLSANASTSATWNDVRGTNIESTYNVFEAARRAGANKVVFATTNHVMGFYNLEGAWPIDTRAAIRPDSLYGVSKAFGEALVIGAVQRVFRCSDTTGSPSRFVSSSRPVGREMARSGCRSSSSTGPFWAAREREAGESSPYSPSSISSRAASEA